MARFLCFWETFIGWLFSTFGFVVCLRGPWSLGRQAASYWIWDSSCCWKLLRGVHTHTHFLWGCRFFIPVFGVQFRGRGSMWPSASHKLAYKHSLVVLAPWGCAVALQQMTAHELFVPTMAWEEKRDKRSAKKSWGFGTGMGQKLSKG